MSIFILWLLGALAVYMQYTHLWQLKEYRLDRFLDFFRTKKGKNYWQRILYRSFFIFFVAFVPFNQTEFVKAAIIATALFDVAVLVYRKYQKNMKRPIVTTKVVLIMLSAIFVEGMIFLVTKDWVLMLALVYIRFFILMLVVWLFSYPTSFAKKAIIARATRKIALYSNLTIVGITGSYGKTTTKEFLAHVLGNNFRVIKTPKNVNTDIGIAQFILKHTFSKYDVFVVEMGAYKIGEIHAICEIVKPSIGILTAINEQHLSLFGSLENTQQAKAELLHSLPKDGLAITNIDNDYCRAILTDLQVPIQTFGISKQFAPTCLVEDLQQKWPQLHCQYQIGDVTFNCKTSILGEHNCINLAPIILVARFLGVNYDDIRARIQTLQAVPGALQFFRYGKSIVIDDSYNANPSGFQSALHLLSHFGSGKQRVVITRGMLELGKMADQKHEEIGGEIAYITDTLILTSNDFEEAFRRGVGHKFHTKVIMMTNRDQLLTHVKPFFNTEAVILLENRLPNNVYAELTREGPSTDVFRTGS